METTTKQLLLLNAMQFAHQILGETQFQSIPFEQGEYRVSGETDMFDVRGEGCVIQSFVYSSQYYAPQERQRVMILANGQCYDSRS